jgi:hypothetical protein
LRSGSYLSKSERFNTITGFSRDIPSITVNSLCGCQVGTTVNKPGLCPTCRK